MPILEESKKLLRGYIQQSKAPSFLTSMFTWDGQFHNQAKLEFDTKSISNQVAVPLPAVGADGNKNNTSAFDVEEFAPVVYEEEETISAASLVGQRQFDTNPYTDSTVQLRGMSAAMVSAGILREKIIRGVELQASQIFTTGQINLIGKDGSTVYTANYGLDSNLFFTTANAWGGGATSNVLGDLATLANVQNAGGGGRSVAIVLNSVTLAQAMKDTEFKAAVEKCGNGTGVLFPLTTEDTSAGKYYGRIASGSWIFDIYVNDETYVTADGTAGTKYIPDNKCVMLTNGYRQATYGQIPTFNSGRRALVGIPRQVTAEGIPMSFNSWFEQNNKSITFSIGNRPLLLPRNKYSVGCITTTP